MKKIAYTLVVALMLTIVLSTVACKNETSTKKVDTKNYTQLYMGNYNGGVGNAWLNDFIARFEEEYKDVSFEAGKKGVQIWVDNDKEKYTANSLAGTISSSINKDEVVFYQGENFFDFVMGNNPKFKDITEFVTEKIEGEDKSIEDKLTEHQRNFYKQNGKYYALPHYNGFQGIVYDADLFNNKSLYYGTDGEIGKKLGDSDISTGPDGKPNTYDDGLPATYEQFFALCSYMQNSLGIIPVSWNGAHKPTYTGYVLNALFVDHEGLDRALLQYNAGAISGKNNAVIVTETNASGIANTQEIEISLSNYRELAKQPGRYYALSFLDEIIKNNYAPVESYSDTQSHVMAQYVFLNSRFAKGGKNTIAMLFDGAWWENEATDVFVEMEEIWGSDLASKQSRRFGFMPMPKATSDLVGNSKQTLYDGTSSHMAVNANLPDYKHELVGEIIKKLYSDTELQLFTIKTGTSKAVNYQLKEEQYNQMTYFTKMVWDMHQNADIVYPCFTSLQEQMNINAKNANRMLGFESYVKGSVKNIPVNAFKYDNVSAVDFFKGIYTYINII